MNIQDLPIELQNKIFYYAAEHPCAKMIKKGYADTRRNLQQDDDAYIDATHLTYDGNMDLSKRKNIYFDLVVQKYKNKEYYDIELDDEGNIITNPVLSISKRIEEREKQCKNKQQSNCNRLTGTRAASH